MKEHLYSSWLNEVGQVKQTLMRPERPSLEWHIITFIKGWDPRPLLWRTAVLDYSGSNLGYSITTKWSIAQGKILCISSSRVFGNVVMFRASTLSTMQMTWPSQNKVHSFSHISKCQMPPKCPCPRMIFRVCVGGASYLYMDYKLCLNGWKGSCPSSAEIERKQIPIKNK